MNGLNALLQASTLQQLRDQNKEIPILYRTFSTKQWILFLVGIITSWIFGLGLIFYIWLIVDWFKTDTFRVVNKVSNDKFFMSRVEWKKYKALKKNISKESRTVDQILGKEKKTDGE